MKEYKHAQVKFNGGTGALLCNQCSIILAYGVRHKDVEHYCKECESIYKRKVSDDSLQY
jgi:exosome complex RNA-binding protein Csl4